MQSFEAQRKFAVDKDNVHWVKSIISFFCVDNSHRMHHRYPNAGGCSRPCRTPSGA